jgi:hypothetical protein
MPFKFWKKEEAKPAKAPPKKPEGKPSAKPAEKAPAKAPEKAAPPARRPPIDVAAEIHKGLVEAGMAMEGTREVFKKRLAEKFGSIAAFETTMKEDPQATLTGFVVSWLGFAVPAKFDLADVLYSANQRLSSFGMQVNAADEVSVDDAQGLREATFTLGDAQTILQFQTPREVFSEINAMIRDRGVRFIELETWSDDYAFMLVKSPKWDSLARAELVIVKTEETATLGECPECGSRVGERWATCIACNTAIET